MTENMNMTEDVHDCKAEADTPLFNKNDGRQLQENHDCNDELENKKSGGWTYLLLLSAAVCCLGSAFPAGYNIGVVNNAAYPMIKFLDRSITQRYGVTLAPHQLHLCWSSIVSIFLIGGVIGSLSASYLADRYGRKGALLIGNISGILGGICFYVIPLSNIFEFFWIGRIFAGLSGGLATSLMPMYLTEVAPVNLRATLGVLCQIGITCGILVAQVLGLDIIWGNDNCWHILLYSFMPLCLIASALVFILPESPKFMYIIRGNHELAFKELIRLRNKELPLLQDEVHHLKEESEFNASNSNWSIVEVLKSKKLRLPLILVCVIQTSQQFSGINAVFYYSFQIFINANISVRNAQLATIGTGTTNLFMAFATVYLLSRFGRKQIFLTSCYLAIVCLTILCVSIQLIHIHPIMTWLVVTTTIFYVFGFASGLGPIPFFIGSELFEVGPRPAAMALGSVCNWGSNFIVGMFFPILQNSMGSYTFLIFVIYLLCVTCFVQKYLPETRNKTATEISKILANDFKSKRHNNNNSV